MKNRWCIKYFEGYKISCTSETEGLVESLTNSKCKSLLTYNLCCKRWCNHCGWPVGDNGCEIYYLRNFPFPWIDNKDTFCSSLLRFCKECIRTQEYSGPKIHDSTDHCCWHLTLKYLRRSTTYPGIVSRFVSLTIKRRKIPNLDIKVNYN